MGLLEKLTGRGWRVAGFVAALCCVVALTLACPGRAAAEGYESMMPEQLSKELRKAQTEYRKVMEEVRAAENERLARKASGAADAALREADEAWRKLIGKAEELKIKVDYIDELYEAKQKEYSNN